MKTQLSSKNIVDLVAAWHTEFSRQREELIVLDQAVGDGDLGITMQKAFAAAAQVVFDESKGLEHYLIQCGLTIAKAAPSTMGTLMATGFMRGGKALPAGTQTLDGEACSVFFAAFAQGIAERGKARPGDKTVLDVLLPASDALAREVQQGNPLPRAADGAYRAAQEGLEATRSMVPRHGKAACFVDNSAGRADPGGTAALILFRVFSEFVDQ